MIGLSEHQLKILDPQDSYDLTVDTFANTSAECAKQIIANLPTAKQLLY